MILCLNCWYSELEETVSTLLNVEADRLDLQGQTEALQLNLQVLPALSSLLSCHYCIQCLCRSLQDLSKEREDTIAQLQKHQSATEQLTKENESLNAVTENLQTNLSRIESKMQRIVTEKMHTQQLWVEFKIRYISPYQLIKPVS